MLPTSHNGNTVQVDRSAREESSDKMSKAYSDGTEQSVDALSGKSLVETTGEKGRPLSQSLAQGVAAKSLSDSPQDVLLQSFWPSVAVYTSADTEELTRLKGIYGGFCDLLKPFGERVYGKVNVRDSMGGSRSWDDFGVHFTNAKRASEFAYGAPRAEKLGVRDDDGYVEKGGDRSPSPLPPTTNTHASDMSIDRVMQSYLRKCEATLASQGLEDTAGDVENLDSPHHTHYLRKVLAPRPVSPHDTFTHPVACLIVTSSQSPAPIEKLRDLYGESRHGDNMVPDWAGTDFLRYYVLVHDEDHDDIGRSTMIYEQMKRHFGLHCHLLRLRSTECNSATVDSIRLPSRTWPSLEESILEVQQQDDDLLIESSDLHSYLFNTDVDAITMFIREMITQSIIPFMEGRVTKWNDQVVSRRRGISGRFMSLSKRWTGFGSSRGSSPSPAGSINSKNNNFNYSEGYYLPDSSEATMQRLADYAFMLRDWKLSSCVYDLLRIDFADDKAWRQQAFVSQMAVTSLLLDASLSGARVKPESTDQSIESALYSYNARCADPAGAIRFLVMLVELLTLSGNMYSRDASKWAMRLLELSILSPISQAFTCERLASTFLAQRRFVELQWGSQGRNAAFWSLLAAYSWDSLGFSELARMQWRRARGYYNTSPKEPLTLPLASMYGLWDSFSQGLARKSSPSRTKAVPDDVQHEPFEETKEQLNDEVDSGEQTQHFNLPVRANSLGNDEALRLNGSMQPDDGFSCN